MPGQQSAWHTVRSAELWFYHRGGPLLLEVGAEQDTATTHLLGSDIAAGEQAAAGGPARALATRPARADDEPCLVSCVVVPGFDFADFTLDAPTDSSRTAAATSSALSAAVDPSGSRSVSSIPIRVWTPT